MTTTILTLTPGGLALARSLREEIGEGATIYGPSCVVGRCGEPSGGLGALDTDEPGLKGWAGPLRNLVERLWLEADAVVAIMPIDPLVRWIGPLAARGRSGPAVVAVDEGARFVVGVLRGPRADVGGLVALVSRCSGGQAVTLGRPSSLGREES